MNRLFEVLLIKLYQFMSKNYFGLLDTRNTKYQGLLRDDKFAGIGILIDNFLMTIVSQWKGYTLNGPTLIVFPYLQMFYGQIYENQTKGVCCFQLNERQKIIFNDKFARIAHIFKNSTITYLQKSQSTGKITVRGTFNIYSSSQEYQILRSKIFVSNNQISPQILDAKLFIQHHFAQKYKQLQLVSSSNSKQIFFGFKNTSSLGFKLQKGTFFPAALGCFDEFPRHLNFGRKIYPKTFPKIQIEQGNFLEPQKTFIYSLNQGSVQSQRYNDDFFKKSMTFRNQFTRLQHIDRLYIELKKLQKKIENQTVQRFGQELLQGPQEEQGKEVIAKQYTLSEVKQDIYKAAAKRHDKDKYSRDINQQVSPLKFSAKHKHVQSEFIYQDQSHPLSTISRRKQFNYLDEKENKDIKPFRLSPSRQISYRPLERQKSYWNIPKRQKQSSVHRLNEIETASHRQILIQQINKRIQAEKKVQTQILKRLINKEELERQLLAKQQKTVQQMSYEKFVQTKRQNRYKKYTPYQYKAKNQHRSGTSPMKARRSPIRTFNYTQQQNQKITQFNPYHGSKTPKNKTLYSRSPVRKAQQDKIQENQEVEREFQHLARYKQRKRKLRSPNLDNQQQAIQKHQKVPEIKLFQQGRRNNNVSSIRSKGLQNSEKQNKSVVQSRKMQRQVNTTNRTPQKVKRTFHYID